MKRLTDPSARARFLAALALGRLQVDRAVAPLVDLLEVDGNDPYLRHAAITGLVGCADATTLAALASHPSVPVRVGAVVALRRMAAPEVATFLHDPEPRVVAEAARAIHDDWSIPEALPALAALAALRGAALADGAVGRRVVGANLRLRETAGIARVLALAASDTLPIDLRVAALEAVAGWSEPPLLDAVEGRYRPLEPVAKAVVAEAAGPALAGLLADPSKPLAAAAAAAARAVGAGAAPADMVAWVADRARDAGERASALEGVAASGEPEAIARALEIARESGEPVLRAAALRVSAARDPGGFPALAREVLASGSVPEKQAALALLAEVGSAGAGELVRGALDALVDGRVEPALQLDVLEAAQALDSDEVAARVRVYHGAKDPADPLAPFQEVVEGGDPARGADIFANNIAAQCTLCHRVGESGSQVGPALSEVGARATRQQLLESLVLPNAFVAPGFGFSTLTLRDGKTVSGALAGGDDGTLRVGTPDGEIVEIASEDIVSQTAPVSTMPPVGALLSPREIRDLVAYLAGLK